MCIKDSAPLRSWMGPWRNREVRCILVGCCHRPIKWVSAGMGEIKNQGYFHLAMARATCLKLVMRHFAPLPTSEARRCCFAAACGLHRALRTAAIRLRASCFFNSMKEIFFTINPYRIWCLVTNQSSGTATNRPESLLRRRLIHYHHARVPFAPSGRF
jgi:hypothetical protein